MRSFSGTRDNGFLSQVRLGTATGRVNVDSWSFSQWEKERGLTQEVCIKFRFGNSARLGFAYKRLLDPSTAMRCEQFAGGRYVEYHPTTLFDRIVEVPKDPS